MFTCRCSSSAESKRVEGTHLGVYLLMTTNAAEETNLPEIASNSMDWIAQLVERWSTNPKVMGSNPTPVEVFGLRLLTITWRKTTSE